MALDILSEVWFHLFKSNILFCFVFCSTRTRELWEYLFKTKSSILAWNGWKAAAHQRRKCLVSDAPSKVMKTLGPEGIFPYIESLINMCIPSLHVNPSSSLSLHS